MFKSIEKGFKKVDRVLSPIGFAAVIAVGILRVASPAAAEQPQNAPAHQEAEHAGKGGEKSTDQIGEKKQEAKKEGKGSKKDLGPSKFDRILENPPTGGRFKVR